MQIFLGIIIGLLVISVGPLLLVLSLRWLTQDDVTTRLEEFTGMGIATPEQRLTPEMYAKRLGLTGTFIERTITPFIRRTAKFIGRLTPAQVIEELEHQLIIAGQPLGLGAREFWHPVDLYCYRSLVGLFHGQAGARKS